uniref:Molybdopterin synthase catalytic subunit n=1 Tax=Glossina brevipalpis TaxID=37001 RepID=A0A1A9W2Q8_9MUSC
MNHLLLTKNKLDVGEISNLLGANSCGAISIFIGTTRDNFEEKRVVSLEYEAYEPMAIKELGNICDEIRRRWPDCVNVAIYHRLGLVPVGENSVVIGISSPHRQTSLDSVAFAIDELKKNVPIWKKEIYDNLESSWKANKEYKKRIEFDARICDVDDSCEVPKNFIQISAAEDEIKRRIQCFVEKKREEIDLNNIMDYTVKRSCAIDEDETENAFPINDDDDGCTCARTNSTIVKQAFSKCHLKVRRVENSYGPQTRPDYLQTLDKLMTQQSNDFDVKSKQNTRTLPRGLQERLENIEEHLNISHTGNLYRRIKAIENRLLHLESISPEYKHFVLQYAPTDSEEPSKNYEDSKMKPAFCQRKTCSISEIDAFIERLQSSSKINSRSDDQ